MTKQDEDNRLAYLSILEKIWDLDKESMDFISKRTTDEWQPLDEYKEIFKEFKYENQRYRIPVDFKDKSLSSAIADFDESYKLFIKIFKRALREITVTYEEFLNNKITYKKNVTKIKKVFEKWYLDNWSLFKDEAEEFGIYVSRDQSEDTRNSTVNTFITKAYEKIGEKKKPNKGTLELVVSFNPCDWFLASTSEDFSSCFNLNCVSGPYEGGYRYSLGLPFLNGDPNRCFVYLTKGAEKSWEGIKVDSVLSRSWAFLDKNNKINICKWYPNMLFSPETLNIIANVKNFQDSNYFREAKYPIKVLSTNSGAVISVYNDVGHWSFDKERNVIIHSGNEKSGQQAFTKRGTSVESSSSTYSFDPPGGIKFIYSNWMRMGLSLKNLMPSYNCMSCGDKKGGFFRNREFFCYDCYEDKRKSCNHCSDTFWDTGVNKEKVYRSNGEEVVLCNSCYEHRNDFICSECGCYDDYSISIVDGKRVCRTCLESPKSKYIKDYNGNIILKSEAYVIFDKKTNTTKILSSRQFTPSEDFHEDHFLVDETPIVWRYSDGNRI